MKDYTVQQKGKCLRETGRKRCRIWPGVIREWGGESSEQRTERQNCGDCCNGSQRERSGSRSCGNGRIGAELVGKERYDAVLMNVQMPVMNRYEVTREIRSMGEGYFRRLPIIAMNANTYKDDVEACLDVGMNDHIAKPFNPDDLLRMLHRYCGERNE